MDNKLRLVMNGLLVLIGTSAIMYGWRLEMNIINMILSVGLVLAIGSFNSDDNLDTRRTKLSIVFLIIIVLMLFNF